MLTDTVLDDARWDVVDLAGLCDRAATATLACLDIATDGVEITVLGCDDARIAVLNAEFRGKPTPTNVLSWPSEDRAPEQAGTRPAPPQDLELGDIAIAYDTCAKEAGEAGKPLPDHATHLIVHGILHLLGYDHIRDQDATLMEATEVEILGKLGLPDPY